MIPSIKNAAIAAAEELAEQLLGTCNNELGEPLYEKYSLNADFTSTFDDLVFNCDCCGWWFEANEQDEEYRCEGCHDEAEDSEED